MRAATLFKGLGLAALLCLASCDSSSSSSGGSQPELGQPASYATPSELAAFERGQQIALRQFRAEDGLGPEFNVSSCAACHEKPVTGGSAGLYRNFLLVGDTSPGVFKATGTGGVQPQFSLHSSTRVASDSLTNLHATRNPIAFFGAGLLAEIEDLEILSRVDESDADGDGISGRVNYEDGVLARFGRKAQAATIEGFVRGPLFNHLGITSAPLSAARRMQLPLMAEADTRPLLDRLLFEVAYAQSSSPANASTVDNDGVPDPELSEQELFDLVSFVLLLAAPEPDALSADAEHGEQLFSQIGCAACHVPELDGPRGPVGAYTDLLLHDMGSGLADGVEMGDALGSEFRTQPLWGVVAVGPWLHDGRAASLDEAIRLHAGEAQAARDAFVALNASEQGQLISFLEALGGKSQRSAGLVPPGAPVLAADSYGGPAGSLDAAESARFERGRAAFDRDFPAAEGLGEVFNGDSCRACHFLPEIGGAGPIDVNVMRHGSVNAMTFIEPAIGTIIHRHAVAPDERAEDFSATSDTFYEMRQTPSVFGLGLVEQIPAASIVAGEDPADTDGDGVSGRAHMLADGRLGRFGWKAQVPSLQEFARDAFGAELGISVPAEAGQTFGFGSDGDGRADPEIGLTELQDLVFFMQQLARPPRSSSDQGAELAGEAMFGTVGCADCHTPSLALADGTPVPLFSDLLLHDVAVPGSLGIVDGDASMTEFRTPPLWGLATSAPYFHDGRSDSIEDAVLRHDGEALAARTAYQALSAGERSQLLAFLRSL